MNTLLLTVDIRSELDVVFVRQRARQIAFLLKFEPLDQTRISTAVSEIARNAFLYARGGRAQFFIEGKAEHLVIRISDRGTGIANLGVILAGDYRSVTGMGLGLLGARKLMDTFRADTAAGHGTTIEMGKALPSQLPSVSAEFVAIVSAELAKVMPSGPLEEIRQQNSELLRALDDLKVRQLELDRMYRELAEAHRQMTDINFQLESNAIVLQRTTVAEQLARSEAEAAVALREDMLAIVSHDLRTPLASIVASATVLARQPPHARPEDETRTRTATDIIMRSAHRMGRLIADLLDLAKIRTGKLIVERAEVGADALIQESLETLQTLAAQSSLTLIGRSPSGLRVHCDRERVLQILSNLLSNAMKFTPAGGTITLDASASAQDVLFTVSDTGRGLSPDELPHVFDRFWQAQQKGSAGIGLGLSIVAGLVEAHGGRVWAEGTPGIGSRFSFTLPLIEGHSGLAGPEAAPA